MPLPIVLEDMEEIIIALGFNLSLEFQVGAFSVIECVNYLIVKDYCKREGLDSILILELYKEMLSARIT